MLSGMRGTALHVFAATIEVGEPLMSATRELAISGESWPGWRTLTQAI